MSTNKFDQAFADDVARLCLEKYSKLPRKGKPMVGKEWTLLAGIVMATGWLPWGF